MNKSFFSQLNPQFSRRDLLRASGISLLGPAACPWISAFANQVNVQSKSKRHFILLWMSGGPTQTDTFDLKPDHQNGGEFKPIKTNVSGIEISEHLPNLAKQADKLAIVRGLNTKEGDHGRGTFLMRTGEQPEGNIKYPSICSSLTKELGSDLSELPDYMSITPMTALNPAAFSPGLLGPKYAAASVTELSQPNAAEGFTELGVDFLKGMPGTSQAQADRRLELWKQMESDFVQKRESAAAIAHQTVYQKAVRLMKSDSIDAFDLEDEPEQVRLAYGRGRFGQGCLLARRLIERGVAVVEVALDGWDTHANNFAEVKRLSEELDAGWSSLLRELEQCGLMETTTILWLGEFGRTPSINNQAGRDHFPNAWSCVFAGGGIRGGQVAGKTSADGMEVVERPVGVKDVLATLCKAVGVDPQTKNMTNLKRPIKIVDGGKPIKEIVA